MQQPEEYLFLRCVTHKNSYYQFISLDKGNIQNRLLCPECLIPKESGNVKKELIDLIPLTIVLNQRETFIDWMKKENFTPYLKIFSHFIEKDLNKEFDEQIEQLEKISNLLQELKNHAYQQLQEFKKIQMKFKQYRNIFYEKINFNKLTVLLYQLQDLNQQIESDQYKSVEKDLQQVLEGILQDNFKVYQYDFDEINKEHQKYFFNLKQTIKQDCQEMTKRLQHYQQWIQQLSNQSLIEFPSELINSKTLMNLQFIIEVLSYKTVKTIKLVYSSLKKQEIKFDGKKNLLMILKSKNEGKFVFGAFSPNQELSRLGHNEKHGIESFLFSQKRIPMMILQDQRSKYVKSVNQLFKQPTFEECHDIIVASIFKKGYANLQFTNYWEELLVTKAIELYGDKEPNVGEYEIFEVIFD